MNSIISAEEISFFVREGYLVKESMLSSQEIQELSEDDRVRFFL